MIIFGTKQKEETYGLIARTWDDCAVGDEFTIIQPNDLGGKSLEKKLLSIFPNASSESKDKSRYITITKTNDDPAILTEWRTYNELQFVDEIGFYSMPGIFGWNKIDVGSRHLIDHLSTLSGVGADFGCGYGYLTKYALATCAKIDTLYAFDIDERAVRACQKNVTDDRAVINRADCTNAISDLPKLDFIIMNPPFHDGSEEQKSLGQSFIINAKHHLKKNGHLYLVANKHLPYEKVLIEQFQEFKKIYEGNGFKIFKT